MNDYFDPGNEELLRDFFSEAQAQVDALEQNILALESGDRDAVDELFRAAHTLKGGAATVEMAELARFTHRVEDALDALRSGRLAPGEEAVDALLAAVDIIKAMLERRRDGGVYDGDTSAAEARLAALLPDGKAGPAAAPAAKAGAEAGAPAALSEYERLELREAAGGGEGGPPVYRVRVRFDESGPMNTVGGVQVFAALKDVGTVLKTAPDFEALYGDEFHGEVDYYVASEKTPEEIQRYVTIPEVTLGAEVADIDALDTGATGAKATEAAGREPAAGTETRAGEADASGTAADAAKLERAGKEEAARPAPQREAGSVLRVDARRIDDLLNLVSETVITKATFNQISGRFSGLLAGLRGLESVYREKIKSLFDSLPGYLEGIQNGRPVKEVRKEIGERFGGLFSLFDGFEADMKAVTGKFRSTSQNLGRITGELQEGVMRIRMVPISQIFSRFPRLVRNLSKSLDKKINLVIEGEDTELDKSVIEDLLDPIMHSVRNSADHGIEEPEERRAAGKPEEGMVLLKAGNEGNMIVIEIADDGRGIDVEAVKAKAVERGLVSPGKALTDAEAFRLIFEPGFSTAKRITGLSGRGVGLDVVRRQIDKLNGAVAVSSQKGRGTTFTIKLPLTLAIIQGLLVRVGPEIYSIPITSVIESLRIRPDEIRKIDDHEVFNIRDDVISLLRLNRLFGVKTEERRDYHFIVIVGTAEKKMGFMVDSLIGEEDVVIKPLRDQHTNSPGIAGASILGDGSVSLIIDVGQLLELGLRKEKEERVVRESADVESVE